MIESEYVRALTHRISIRIFWCHSRCWTDFSFGLTMRTKEAVSSRSIPRHGGRPCRGDLCPPCVFWVQYAPQIGSLAGVHFTVASLHPSYRAWDLFYHFKKDRLDSGTAIEAGPKRKWFPDWLWNQHRQSNSHCDLDHRNHEPPWNEALRFFYACFPLLFNGCMDRNHRMVCADALGTKEKPREASKPVDPKYDAFYRKLSNFTRNYYGKVGISLNKESEPNANDGSNTLTPLRPQQLRMPKPIGNYSLRAIPSHRLLHR